MSKFDISKSGYDTKQVDDFINNVYLKYEERLSEQKDRVFALKNELDITQERLAIYEKKDKEISKALVYAVEKANQIEESAKKIFNLEIRRVKLLYKRWEELLLQVESKYPQINSNKQIYSLMESFKSEIDDVLRQNYASDVFSEEVNVKNQLMKKGDGYVKNILNKMDYVFNDNESTNNNAKNNSNQNAKKAVSKISIDEIMQAHDKENNRIANISGKLNSIISAGKPKNGETLADKYLNSDLDSDEFSSTAYAKNITRKNKKSSSDESPFNYPYPEPNETGFDLKDALNPKEDLDKIMASFDFFDNE